MFVHGKDGWAHIYDADGKEVNLITWALNHCHDRGCDDFQCKTLEEYDEALSSCMVDFMDCPVMMAYCFASQAVHLRNRLKMYEDAMPLVRVQELAQVEEDGRLVGLPPNDPLTLEELREMDGEPVYDGVGFQWFVIDSVDDIDELLTEITMTDGTVFDTDEDGVDRTLERFYRRKPEEGKKN